MVSIKNLELQDNWIEKLEKYANNNYTRRSFVALMGSISVGFALSGCGSKQVEEKKTEDNSVIEDNIQKLSESDSTAAYTALEIIKDTTKELKDSTEEIRQTPEMTAQVQNAVKNYDVLYKFMMGEDFDKLEENDKIDMITASMSFTEIINTVEPDYKTEISNKWADIKAKCSDYIEKHDLYNKAVDLGAKAYEKAGSAWDGIKEYANDVKEEAKRR